MVTSSSRTVTSWSPVSDGNSSNPYSTMTANLAYNTENGIVSLLDVAKAPNEGIPGAAGP